MIDVGNKKDTKRKARATGRILMSQKAFAALLTGESPKGNVFGIARAAALLAAKQTPMLIPMCHPLPLSKVQVEFKTDKKKKCLSVTAEVCCTGKTGVEMEALTAVSVAVLTVYDMLKWADHAMVISDICLTEKRGGKSGVYKRKQ